MSGPDRIRIIWQSLVTGIAVVPLILAIIHLSSRPNDRGITLAVVVVAGGGIVASAVILYRYWRLAQGRASRQSE